MKIICDSCGTKYSISDDKVRGKVFKIRCKKCSHIIVVRGGETAPEEAAPAVDGGWHIVVDGEQVGPVSDADIRSRIERGEIRGDTYTWKEGFADWVKLASVPEFAGLTGEGSVPVSMGGDLFPADGQPANGAERSRRPSGARSPLFGSGGGGEDVFAAPARGGGGDLFAASTAHAPAASEQRWPSSGAAAAGHDGGRVENLTAQRHENSVLFSLSNLQSLAMGGGAAKASAAPVATTAPTPEGSGLIDIRAMAASSMPQGMGLGLGSEMRSSGGIADDLPAFGSFSPAAPVLLPLPSGSGAPKWIYPVILLMVAAVGGIGWMAFKVMSARSPLEPERVVVQVPVPTPVPEPAKAKSEDGTKSSTVPDDKLPPREGAKSEGKSADGKSGDGKSRKSRSKEAKSGDKEGKKSASDDKKSSSVPKEATAAAEASAGKPMSDIDKLLAGGVRSGGKSSGGGGDEKKAAAAASEPGGPPLAKGAVVAGMNSIRPKISECYNQFKVPGMAMINVVIGKSGKVTSATAEGKFAGTPSGSCVEKAVKSASFPPSEGLTTKYPFQLK